MTGNRSAFAEDLTGGCAGPLQGWGGSLPGQLATGTAVVAPATGYRVRADEHVRIAAGGHLPPPMPVEAPVSRGSAKYSLHAARVLIVDDCTLHRDNLVALLATNGAAEVAAAWDIETMVAAIGESSPNIMLLNVTTKDSEILLRMAVKSSPELRVIVLGVSEDDEPGIVACAEAGAAGYHTRNESIEDLLVWISRINDGESACSPKISGILLRRLSTLASNRAPVTEDLVLTAREAEILNMLKLGLSNREIADQLCIAVHTVKNHVHSLLTKLGVSTRGQAAALASSL
jgi:DNA-binding NarL/FixJ family response regulator